MEDTRKADLVADDLRIDFRMETDAFNRAVARFVREYRGGIPGAIKRVGFELERRTMLRTTRVDTGRMKNGWHVSFHRRSDWAPPISNPREAHPDPGPMQNMRVLFLQNRVHYAVEHEFGTRRGLSPLLMLTKSVVELRGELVRYLAEGIRPLWNREINGITGSGPSVATEVRERERATAQQARARTLVRSRARAERELGLRAGREALAGERAARARARRRRR